MHKPYANSKKFVDVDNGLGRKIRCWLPKPPPDEEIKNSHLPQEKQVWKRTNLPTFKFREVDWFFFEKEYNSEDVLTWDECRRQEIIKQTGRDPWVMTTRRDAKKILPDGEIDPSYVMESLQAHREAEWLKVFGDDDWCGGEYVYINGNLLYLTRFHYFYLNYWRLDSGWAEFRVTDMHGFYLFQNALTDISLYGNNELTKRGQGKSYRAGAISYLMAISHQRAHVGIQSKTDDDAEHFFKTKIAEPYKDLPDYLVPINKNPSDPKKSLLFFPMGTAGSNAEYMRKIGDTALRTTIDFKSAKDGAYDGWTLKFTVHDEGGKVSNDVGNIQKRLGIIEQCIFRDGRLVGKMYITTTVEEMGAGGDNFLKVWKAGKEYTKEGMPRNRLINIFLPASGCTFFDQFGYPVIGKAKKYQQKYLKQRYGEYALVGGKEFHRIRKKELEGDPTEYIGYCQRNPETDEEAFMVKGRQCIYNAAILQEAQKRCQDPDYESTIRGDFVWIEKDKSVRFVENKINGRWEVSWLFGDDEKYANKVGIRRDHDGLLVTPLNDVNFGIAFDPFKTGVTQSKRKDRSNAAIAVYRKPNLFEPEYSDTWIADYVARPQDPEEATEDLIMACVYFGCKALIENNINDPLRYMEKRGYGKFVMMRPPSTFPKGALGNDFQITPGVPSSEPVIEQYIARTKHHIVHHGHKLRHLRIIRDFLEFDPVNRTKFDLGVAAQLSLLAAENSYAVDFDPDYVPPDMKALFPTFN